MKSLFIGPILAASIAPVNTGQLVSKTDISFATIEDDQELIPVTAKNYGTHTFIISEIVENDLIHGYTFSYVNNETNITEWTNVMQVPSSEIADEGELELLHADIAPTNIQEVLGVAFINHKGADFRDSNLVVINKDGALNVNAPSFTAYTQRDINGLTIDSHDRLISYRTSQNEDTNFCGELMISEENDFRLLRDKDALEEVTTRSPIYVGQKYDEDLEAYTGGCVGTNEIVDSQVAKDYSKVLINGDVIYITDVREKNNEAVMFITVLNSESLSEFSNVIEIPFNLTNISYSSQFLPTIMNNELYVTLPQYGNSPAKTIVVPPVQDFNSETEDLKDRFGLTAVASHYSSINSDQTTFEEKNEFHKAYPSAGSKGLFTNMIPVSDSSFARVNIDYRTASLISQSWKGYTQSTHISLTDGIGLPLPQSTEVRTPIFNDNIGFTTFSTSTTGSIIGHGEIMNGWSRRRNDNFRATGIIGISAENNGATSYLKDDWYNFTDSFANIDENGDKFQEKRTLSFYDGNSIVVVGQVNNSSIYIEKSEINESGMVPTFGRSNLFYISLSIVVGIVVMLLIIMILNMYDEGKYKTKIAFKTREQKYALAKNKKIIAKEQRRLRKIKNEEYIDKWMTRHNWKQDDKWLSEDTIDKK